MLLLHTIDMGNLYQNNEVFDCEIYIFSQTDYTN